jgi:hypothetical protein
MVTIAGFLDFIRNAMQIPVQALPDDSPSIPIALAIAEDLTNPALRAIQSPSCSTLGYTGPGIYELAVYNLGGDNLINFAQDVSGGTFFQTARQSYGINSFVAGVISSTSDNGTGESMVVPESLKNITLQNLQQLKTPYGRQWLYFSQAYGTLWGIS